MKRVITIGMVLCITIIIAVLCYKTYQRSLTPQFVGLVRLSDCRDLEFTSSGIAMGPRVDALVPPFDKGHSVSFAVRERKAVQFKPERFHGVYGKIIFEPGMPETVYLYTCDKRWRVILIWN